MPNNPVDGFTASEYDNAAGRSNHTTDTCAKCMKILMITTSYPRDESDSSGIFIKRLALALTRCGGRITVLAPGDKEARDRETADGIEIVRFRYAPRGMMRIAYGDGGIYENIKRFPWLVLLMPLFLLSMCISAIRLAPDCDIIHANWLPTGLCAVPAKFIRRRPLIVTALGSDFGRGAGIFLFLLTRTADAITTINEKWAESLKKETGCSVFYTPNGVEVSKDTINPRERFGIACGEILVLYVGALRHVKGADILSEVACIVGRKDKSVRFLVIGPGNPSEFGLSGLTNVTLAGRLPPTEVLALIPGCDIFVLPSRHEGRPNALLEAMAAGVPSVATRLPGVVEVLTGKCGIIVDTENPAEMADAVCLLAKDPEKRRMMGRNARSRISELSLDWESSAKNYLEIFRRFTRETQRTRR
ncbi:MAG: glycosyltransferase family 4 protein [Pseudomonadota bacterium]